MPEYPQPGGDQRSQQKFLIFDKFKKLNTQAARVGLPDDELAWLENLQPLSENKLQVVPAAAAAAFASIPGNIELGFYATINGQDYAILFTDAGAGWYVNFTTNTVGQFAPDGTFSNAPDCTTWQGSRILINDSVAGYCTWDGNVFVRQGGMSPNIVITNGGANYGSPPNVTFVAGSGQGVGATFTAQIVDGQVVNVTLTNPGTGFLADDAIFLHFDGGAGSGATLRANMSTATLTGVLITNSGAWQSGHGPGTGTYPLVISGGGGSGAAATATVSFNPNPAIAFYVSSVTVTNPGSGYTSAPAVTWNNGAFPITAVIPTFAAQMSAIVVNSLTVLTGGSGYPASSTVPLLFFGGGAFAQATGTATINSSGVVVSAARISGGSYPIGNAPTAVVPEGAGAAALAQPWPFVPKGTTLAVFQGRVWLGGGNLLQWTGTGANAGAPGSGVPGPGYDDFQAIDASGLLQIVDADLVHSITALRSLNNYLWIVGDQSVKQIGNISVSAGNVTLFTILTLSSDQGTIWPKSCISYNRIFLFANPNGIFGVFGSTVQKISDDLDGIFQRANFTQQPQGAIVDLNSKHNAVFLLKYVDPLSSTRSLLLMFDGKKWWLARQGDNLRAILTFPQFASDLNTLFGSLAGTDLTQLFAAPNIAVPFRMQTALSHHGNPLQGKRVVRAGFTADAAGSMTVNQSIDFDLGSDPNAFGVTATSLLVGGANDANNTPVTGAGVYLGTTITGTLANIVLQNAIIEYQETSLWKGA